MEFEASKTDLMHFTRIRQPRKETLQVGSIILYPKESTPFLGVYLGQKLDYKAYAEVIKRAITTQISALIRLVIKI